MNSDKNNNLDELIIETISRDKPKFDFNKWKENHQREIEIYESQEEMTSSTFEPNPGRVILWYKAACIAATFLVICSLAACFVLSGKVTNLSGKVTGLKNQLEQAQAKTQQDIEAAEPDNSATLNLYLREHQDVVARHASVSSTTPQPAQMRVNQHDILYYEFFNDEPEYMSPGIIIKGPPNKQQASSSEAPVISNGHILSLSEARQAAGFNLVSPSWLYPGYELDQIRRIDGRDALQLLYTDGINSVSLFEQLLDGQQGLSRQDFREYAVYRNKEQAGGTILAWRDDKLSYVLISNIEMSQLMDMAQSISAER